METYKRFPIAIVKGKGCWVWDEKGNRYLDAVSGIATCSLGHSHKKLRKALTKQLDKIQHVSNLYRIPEQEILAEWLVRKSCTDKVFFCNSGAEANEAAIKLSRKYGKTKRGIDQSIILTAKASFHGRTLASLSATGQSNYHKGFEPLVKGFKYFIYNDLDSFQKLLNEVEANGPKVSSVLIEPLQGEGGVNPGDLKFFKELRKICTKKQILLILDEVQTGMGRTGRIWGYENLDIEPDAMTIAKGLGGGHAIGALLVKNSANIFIHGDHASTFGGNPFACTAAITVAKEIEKSYLIKNVNSRSEQLKEGLRLIINDFPNQLKEVRGLGLIQGLVLKDQLGITAKEIVEEALNENLLLVPAGTNVIRFVPPLIIQEHEVKELLKRLVKTLSKLFK